MTTFSIVTLSVSLLALCWQVYAIGRRVIRLEVRANGYVGGGESPDALAQPCVCCGHKNGYHNISGCVDADCLCTIGWYHGKRLGER